jgi:Ca-activated chloride channel family protein
MMNSRKPAWIVVCAMAALSLAFAQQGPTREGSESVAKPRKKGDTNAETPEGPKIPSKFEKKPQVPEGAPSFKSDVTAVTLDVAVLDNKGRFIPNIQRQYFRVLEDNVPQPINNFSLGEAPMTVVLLIEFSNRWQSYYTESWYQTLTAAYGFMETLKPEDYVAVVAYDMRPEVLTDFTTNKRDAYAAMQRLQIASFSESNLYDALAFTIDRMQEIEGRKAIVTITSGDDTFSKLTYDKTRKILQEGGVPIYAIGIGQALKLYLESRVGPLTRMDWLQAELQLRTFAKETGGQAFFPRFYGEFPSIFRAISEALRNQYSLTYNPTNVARDGSYRKIKVELVDPGTGAPLKIQNEKGKPIKYQIIAKSGYKAPREVE